MNIAHQCIARSAVFALAAAAAAAIPALASAQNQPNPIEIRSCSPIYAPPTAQVFAMGLTTVAGVEIDYVNRGAVPADEVTFAIGAGTDATALNDRGTFAPGVPIRRFFWTDVNADTSACRVTAVRLHGDSVAMVYTVHR